MMTTTTKKNSNIAILLVEDEPISQMVVGGMLKNAGYTFDVAGNGAEAFKLATNRLYQLILMDIELPDMTGIDVTAKIRSKNPKTHTPIVAFTTHTEKEIKEQCFKSGMDGFANKPLSKKELYLIITKYAKA